MDKKQSLTHFSQPRQSKSYFALFFSNFGKILLANKPLSTHGGWKLWVSWKSNLLLTFGKREKDFPLDSTIWSRIGAYRVCGNIYPLTRLTMTEYTTPISHPLFHLLPSDTWMDIFLIKYLGEVDLINTKWKLSYCHSKFPKSLLTSIDGLVNFIGKFTIHSQKPLPQTFVIKMHLLDFHNKTKTKSPQVQLFISNGTRMESGPSYRPRTLYNPSTGLLSLFTLTKWRIRCWVEDIWRMNSKISP